MLRRFLLPQNPHSRLECKAPSKNGGNNAGEPAPNPRERRQAEKINILNMAIRAKNIRRRVWATRSNLKGGKMRSSTKLIIAAMSLFFEGCGPGMMPLKPDTAKTLKNRKVTLIRVSPNTSFHALEFNPVLGGAILSTAIATSKGKSIITSNNIEDPAIALANNLSMELNGRYGTKTTFQAKAKTTGDITQKKYPRTDLALYVQTVAWRLAYYASDFDSYYVEYKAEFGLIDVRQDKVLTEGTCKISPDTPERGMEFDDYTRSNAALLKKEFRNAVDFCTNLFKRELFPR
jgi:hypothetical protein